MPETNDDDDGIRPLPHPLDRTWLHPSELFAALRDAPTGARPTEPSPRARSWRRDVLLTAAAGTLGAVTAVAVLSIVGALDREVPLPASPSRTGASDAAEVAAHVAPGIAAVIIVANGTERRGSGIAVGTHQILTTASVVDTAGSRAQDPGTPGPSAPDSGIPPARIEVCVADGQRHRATEIGRDGATGLVLLSVPTLRVEPAPLANADALRAGDWIAAIGRTSSSGPWVTTGVVTATGGWTTDAVGTAYAGMITTSTELDSDARGGALVDHAGRVVGILAGTGTAPARGTAMPVDMAAAIATQLAAKGWASHGALGVRAADAGATGASITDVTVGSSAQTAGLRVGDRIVAINMTKTPDTATLVYELRRRAAGQRVQITARRGNATLRVTAVLEDVGRPESRAPSPAPVPGGQPASQPLTSARP